MGRPIAKAHAYGNDFLYLPAERWDGHDWEAEARTLCARHTGAGADGLILYWPTPDGARMRLFNADGSPAEVSGNGVRGLAALLVWKAGPTRGPGPRVIQIATDAGSKRLELLDRDGPRSTFRAAMGQPEHLHTRTLDVDGEAVEAVVVRVGNPQCVVLETALSDERYRRLGPRLEHHAAFPDGTNVEFAVVEAPNRVRILIWERGVGPTLSSGTGSCAAAVAARHSGGASTVMDVIAPGGQQRVEWGSDGLFLTGWAEVLWEGEWTR
ncbi:MAG: diaminopimelate epimerase [Vicinamibacterales bacterium]|nr:diaminopimelate epimerase [Vicinamibacterales bacterium]